MAAVVCPYLRCGATINNNIGGDNVPTKFCYNCGYKLSKVFGLCADKYYRSAKAEREFGIDRGIENYKELSPLGNGRYGSVHIVMNRINKQRYAKKVIEINEELKLSPELDAECLLNLNHPNIAIAYERFFYENKLSVIMEYFPRGSLKSFLEDHKTPLSEITLTNPNDKTCVQSIIHRNLKPSNLLITADRSIKISDFGYAKLLDDKDATTCTHTANVDYCAPEVLEQFQYRRYGKKVDNWSVGVILYEMVTRKLPFAGEDVYETKSNIRSDNPDMNGKEFKKYTSPLKVLCINLLKKNPDNRPDTQQCSNWFQQVAQHIAGLEDEG